MRGVESTAGVLGFVWRDIREADVGQLPREGLARAERGSGGGRLGARPGGEVGRVFRAAQARHPRRRLRNIPLHLHTWLSDFFKVFKPADGKWLPQFIYVCDTKLVSLLSQKRCHPWNVKYLILCACHCAASAHPSIQYTTLLLYIYPGGLYSKLCFPTKQWISKK